MTLSTDVLTVSSLGTGVAETQLNGATYYSIPTGVNCILEMASYFGETGALTAAEALLLQLSLRSPDIKNLEPRRYVPPATFGGLGTFGYAGAPLLHYIPVNIDVGSQQRLGAYGTPQVANTVAPDMGLKIRISTEGRAPIADLGGAKRPIFWEKPDNESATGTAAGALTTGNNILVTDVEQIIRAYERLGGGVITASESIYGYAGMNSNAMEATPLRYAFQTIAVALGTAIGIAIPADFEERVKRIVNGQGQATFVTENTLEEAVTAALVFIEGFGYTKKGIN